MIMNLFAKSFMLSVPLLLLVACGGDGGNSQSAEDLNNTLGANSSASLDNTLNPDGGFLSSAGNGSNEGSSMGAGEMTASSSSEVAPLSSSVAANTIFCKLNFSRYQGYGRMAYSITSMGICAGVTECTIENMMPYRPCVDNEATVEGCYGGSSPTVEVVEACPEEDANVCRYREVGEIRFYGAGDKCESVPLDIFK